MPRHCKCGKKHLPTHPQTFNMKSSPLLFLLLALYCFSFNKVNSQCIERPYSSRMMYWYNLTALDYKTAHSTGANRRVCIACCDAYDYFSMGRIEVLKRHFLGDTFYYDHVWCQCYDIRSCRKPVGDDCSWYRDCLNE